MSRRSDASQCTICQSRDRSAQCGSDLAAIMSQCCQSCGLSDVICHMICQLSDLSGTPACQRGRLHLCVNVLCMYINIASERRRSVSPHTQWALVTPASRFGSPQPHQAREECLADLVDLQSHKELQRSVPGRIRLSITRVCMHGCMFVCAYECTQCNAMQ